MRAVFVLIDIQNLFGEIEMRILSTRINIQNLFGEIEMKVLSTRINVRNIFREIERRIVSTLINIQTYSVDRNESSIRRNKYPSISVVEIEFGVILVLIYPRHTHMNRNESHITVDRIPIYHCE